MSGSVFALHRGATPLLVSLPHVGTLMPEDIRQQYEVRSLAVEDTDWHLDQLYAFVREMGASLIVPRYSRYVIDLNRSPENAPMYAGTNNTELCPTRVFTGDAMYRNGYAPDDGEIKRRLDAYWHPYHQALTDELTRLKATYGHAILFDGHSIKSELPWLFKGRLPDLNLGTVNGTSCAPALRAALTRAIESQTTFTHAIDERFKGGYITRNYGRPGDRWHAVQLEMTWCCYMRESPPYAVDAARAVKVQPVLRKLVQTMFDWTPHRTTHD
jgi:N-formylglutamate deformylase